MPAVVFVTAYDEYALRAFEIHALDYLLKPFSAERFRSALNHAREHLHSEAPRWRRHGPRRPAFDLGRAAASHASVWSSARAAGSTSFPSPTSTGARPPATTSGSTSDRRRISSAETMSHLESELGSPQLRPHPPLHDRQHQPDRRASLLLQRRIHRHSQGRHQADAQPWLPRGPPDTPRQGALTDNPRHATTGALAD